MNFYFYIFLAPICFATGNVLFKFWALQEKLWLLISALALFVVGNLFIAQAIKLTSLVATISIVPMITFTLSLLIGFFYFHERLSATQYLGLFFAVVAITLLAFPFLFVSK
jgi:multidrug transporter EmrE-like cation transporter